MLGILLFLCGCHSQTPSSAAPQSSQPSCPYPPLPEQRGAVGSYTRENFFTLVDDGDQMYQLHQPAQKEQGKKYPIVIQLHGAGEAGNVRNYPQTLVIGETLFEPLRNMINRDADTYECYAVMPINYTSTNIRRIIERLVRYEQGDADRVYLTGISAGGFGTCRFMYSFPEMLACAVPVCGCTQNKERVEALTDLPIRIYHSTDDTVVSITTSRGFYNLLKQAGSEKVTFYELKGYGHAAWNAAYNTETVKWMFLQNRSDRG